MSATPTFAGPRFGNSSPRVSGARSVTGRSHVFFGHGQVSRRLDAEPLEPGYERETMTTTASAQPTVTLTGALTAGLTGGLIAAVVNAVIYFAAQSLNGGPIIVEAGASPQPLALPAVLMFSVLPGLVAGLVYWVLARFTRRPARWFLLVSALVLVGFFFGPLGAASGVVAVWALELMHFGAAVPIVWALLGRRG